MTWYEAYDGIPFLCLLCACVLLSLAGLMPGAMLSVVLLGAGVVLFGLPHGSLDVLVARRLFALTRVRLLAVFLAVYLAISAAYSAVWWRFPTVALAAFLILSGIHFSTDWEQRGTLMTRLAYGFAIVTLPALSHPADVRVIYQALGVTATKGLLLAAQIVALPAASVAFAGAFGQRRFRRRDLLEIGGIVLGGLVLPPLLYFTCYFCFLHSPRHLFTTIREEGLVTSGQVFRQAAGPTLAVCAMAAVLLANPSYRVTSAHLLQVIFVGLAVLTIPHMVLKVFSMVGSAARSDRVAQELATAPADAGVR